MPLGPTVNNNDASYTTVSNAPQLENYSKSRYYVKGTAAIANDKVDLFLSKGGGNKSSIEGTFNTWDVQCP